MMSLEDALIACLRHSSKEQWIILLVYWAASQLQKCLFLLFWPAFDRLASPSSIKSHFLIMRIRPVNKENNPLLLSAMAYAYQFKGKKKHPKINPHGF